MAKDAAASARSSVSGAHGAAQTSAAGRRRARRAAVDAGRQPATRLRRGHRRARHGPERPPAACSPARRRRAGARRRRRRRAAAAAQTAELSAGLEKLFAGSTDLQPGSPPAQGQRRPRRRHEALDRRRPARRRAERLEDGAAALSPGSASSPTVRAARQRALGRRGPAGQLAAGLGTMEAKVAKSRGAIPSTKDLEKLKRQSPGLFDSGYFVLAAVSGAPEADRARASPSTSTPVAAPARSWSCRWPPATRRQTRQLGQDLRLDGAVRDEHGTEGARRTRRGPGRLHQQGQHKIAARGHGRRPRGRAAADGGAAGGAAATRRGRGRPARRRRDLRGR